jgi:DNA-binding HxlR family transcriptional regulator
MLGKQGNTIRYSEIREKLTEESSDMISDSTLSRKLSELTNIGIVSRKSYDEVPPRVEYGLTDAGMTLFHTLHQVAEWTREQCHSGVLRIPKG